MTKKNYFLLVFIIFIMVFTISGCEEDTECTVTYNSNGGTIIESVILMPNTSLTLPTPPEREGYTFDGWFTDNELFSNEIENNYVIVSDKILYAKWSPNQYNISFISNGGNYIAPIIYTYDDIIILPNAPIKEDYLFGGWYYDSSFTNKLNVAINLTSDITLYADWVLFLGEPLYNGQIITESGLNKFTLIIPSETPDYYHNLLTFTPGKEGYTYIISENPEIIEGEAMVIITVSDENSNELGTVEISISIE